MSVQGMAELSAVLKNLGPRLLEEGGRALYQEALEIEKASMRRTPVDTGALRASHETSRPELGGGEVVVTIKVGGPAAPYAPYVHDKPARHAVGEDRFLQKSVLEAQPGLAERLGRRIDLARAARR